MSNYWNNQLMLPAAELIEAMTGSPVLIGELLFNPVKLILDNHSDDEVILYMSRDGGTTKIRWHTFPAAEAIVIDDDLYTLPKGTQFYGDGNGTGNFSISYFYLKE